MPLFLSETLIITIPSRLPSWMNIDSPPRYTEIIFFSWIKKPQQTYSESIKELREQMTLWTENIDPSEVNWVELLLRYRFDSQLSDELNLFILDKRASTLQECFALADEYNLHRRLVLRTRINSNPNMKPRDTEHRPPAPRPYHPHHPYIDPVLG